MSDIYTENASNLSQIDYNGLMSRRIHKVLLICSNYDAYALEEDGRIDAQISKEYYDLNLNHPPIFNKVPSAEEAMRTLAEDSSYDLIISMYNIGPTDVFELTRTTKQKYPDIPTVLLINHSVEILRRIENEDRSSIDYIFCWNGNADLIMAIVKTIEDRMNADSDILEVGVQCILLVEDSIRFYSTYLPAIYKIILQQSNEFLCEALNEQQQTLRKRARPKILLATNYNDAVELFNRYKEHMLGVISDVGFVMDRSDRKEDEKLDAGIMLCKLVKEEFPLMPFLLQSSQESIKEIASQLKVGFLVKHSKSLISELSEYIYHELAFGDFVFKDPDTGEALGHAKDLRDMQKMILEVPEKSILYHSAHNHFSKWMYARGLFSIATLLKSFRPAQFSSTAELCRRIANLIKEHRYLLGQGVVARFEPENYSEYIRFARIGEGSLGGKARGLAFINNMLQTTSLYDKYEGVRIQIPRTIVIATDYFDEFIIKNGLQYIINSDLTDQEILSEFTSSHLPECLLSDLKVFISTIKQPLAIRSSSKLEDSHYQPFAGIYSTYMIPHTENADQMLHMLSKAIKSVYASVFFFASRQYIASSSSLLSEEKMAVIIQEVCGTEDHGYFFPTISGVARSLNYYPLGHERPDEGVAEIAFGLGKLVVDGGLTLRFSPKHPRNILQLSTIDLVLRETQRELYVLDLKPEKFKTSVDEAINLRKLDINAAKDFRNIKHVASTWDMQNQSISDSSFDEGHKIITFANILKYNTFPLANILSDLLDIGEKEMQNPIEIEFAVNLDTAYGEHKIFNFLQIRPIVDRENHSSIDWEEVDYENTLIYAKNAVGTGKIENIRDVVYVKEENFDSSLTEAIATEISEINETFKESSENYALIGPGRWGSSDPWLGIPIRWTDISLAKIIVEYGFEGLNVEASQGTHFFHNLVSLGAGYLTIKPFAGDGKYDQTMYGSASIVKEGKYVRHVRFAQPLYIFVDGRNNKAIIKVLQKQEIT